MCLRLFLADLHFSMFRSVTIRVTNHKQFPPLAQEFGNSTNSGPDSIAASDSNDEINNNDHDIKIFNFVSDKSLEHQKFLHSN